MIMTFGSAEAGLEAMGKEWMLEMIQFMQQLDEDLKKSGELVSAEGLADGSQAKTVRFQNGIPVATDGPFAEAKELVGGYWMIQVKSKEEAIEWASRAPMPDGEVIEIRQVQEMSDFPPDVREAAAGFSELQAQSKRKES